MMKFTKMHGLGNDFVVIDAVNQRIALTPERVRALADRRLGVGCDQVLLVEPARSPDTAFYYRIYNADGSEVGQCGNGARCFARFVRDQGLTEADVIDVGTASGPIRLAIETDGRVRVDMGPPEFVPERIPFVADETQLTYDIEIEGRDYSIGALSMGNPHAVLLVDDVGKAPVATLGPLLECHPRFPERVNVGFMAVRDRTRIDLRVYERGAGETLACGTGACAAVVHGIRLGRLDERVDVHLPGGVLVISWRGGEDSVAMTGPSTRVFDGEMPP